jgi:hypothetical protein
MASPEVLGLAKKGDPGAIATLMNQVTQPRGISVRVKAQEDCLHLLFEASQIPKQQTAVSFVRSSLDILKIASLKTVMIYGRQQGSHHTSWHESVHLQPFFDLPPTAPIADSQDKADEMSNNRPLSNSDHSDSNIPGSNLVNDPLNEDIPNSEASESDISESDTSEFDISESDISEFDISESDTSELDIFESDISESDTSELDISRLETPDSIISDSSPSYLTSDPVASEIESVPPLSQSFPTEATFIEAIPVMDDSSLVKQPDAFLAERSEIPVYLQRPEAVVFVAFATLILFWEAYLALLDELAPEASISCRQLAERLQVSKRTVRQRKRQEGFSEWSQSLDPDGIAWVYQSGGLYAPKISI